MINSRAMPPSSIIHTRRRRALIYTRRQERETGRRRKKRRSDYGVSPPHCACTPRRVQTKAAAECIGIYSCCGGEFITLNPCLLPLSLFLLYTLTTHMRERERPGVYVLMTLGAILSDIFAASRFHVKEAY